MQQLNFKRTVFNLDVYGEKLQVKKMTAIELDKHQKNLSKAENDDVAANITFEMLEKQGIPRNIAEDMEMEHLTELITAVLGTASGK